MDHGSRVDASRRADPLKSRSCTLGLERSHHLGFAYPPGGNRSWALSRSGRSRVFWLGFGLCGWAYLALSLASLLAEHLPTTRFLDDLHNRFSTTPPRPVYQDFGAGMALARIHAESFRRAGHALLALLFALLGGVGAMVVIPARNKARFIHPPDGSLLKPGWQDEMVGPWERERP